MLSNDCCKGLKRIYHTLAVVMTLHPQAIKHINTPLLTLEGVLKKAAPCHTE